MNVEYMYSNLSIRARAHIISLHLKNRLIRSFSFLLHFQHLALKFRSRSFTFMCYSIRTKHACGHNTFDKTFCRNKSQSSKGNQLMCSQRQSLINISEQPCFQPQCQHHFGKKNDLQSYKYFICISAVLALLIHITVHDILEIIRLLKLSENQHT